MTLFARRVRFLWWSMTNALRTAKNLKYWTEVNADVAKILSRRLPTVKELVTQPPRVEYWQVVELHKQQLAQRLGPDPRWQVEVANEIEDWLFGLKRFIRRSG